MGTLKTHSRSNNEEELENIEDRRDKLKGKLWMKRVESLLENKGKKGNVLQCCSECGKVYSKKL